MAATTEAVTTQDNSTDPATAQQEPATSQTPTNTEPTTGDTPTETTTDSPTPDMPTETTEAAAEETTSETTSISEEPAPTVTINQAANPEPEVAVTEDTSAPELDEFTRWLAQIDASGTQAEKMVVSGLSKYVNAMAPGKPMEPGAGARNQRMLWDTLFYIVESAPAEEFKRLWNLFLAFFDYYKQGAFADRYVNRFATHWYGSEKDLSSLQRMVNLASLTANPANRKIGLKQVSMAKTLENAFSEAGKQKLQNFYK